MEERICSECEIFEYGNLGANFEAAKFKLKNGFDSGARVEAVLGYTIVTVYY